MSEIKKAFLQFNKSGSEDVVGYALYVEESPAEVTYNSKRIDLGNPADDGSGKVTVDLTTFSELTTKDTVYNFGLVSVDDVGNESSMLTEGLQNIALDFVAPDPPTSASVYYT